MSYSRKKWFGLFLCILRSLDSYAENGLSEVQTGRHALSQPIAGLSEEEQQIFNEGRSLFNQVWVIAPSRDTTIDGLGPFYNSHSCATCHPGNGRGRAPDSETEAMRSMLVRLSIPGSGENGRPKSHPVYGDQLNELAIPGVPREGIARIDYEEVIAVYADSERIAMRSPKLKLQQPGYGPYGKNILTSARIGPAVTGLGCLETVPERNILANADPLDENGDGISGRPNFVWNTVTANTSLGRFGMKANVPTLKQQVAAAMVGDLGITSLLVDEQNCSTSQSSCQQAMTGGDPELTESQLDALVFYHQALAVPAPRFISNPSVITGRTLFTQLNCNGCHTPELKTDKGAEPEFLAGQTIYPYTGLLVNDMGPALEDGRPD